MHVFLFILLLAALLSVVVTLGFGFYALFRGGEFGLKWSNKLMRLRIVLQFTAIALLAATMLLTHHAS
ncbi:MAG TPA: twin transmembrane helix small protein [Caulobacteraceae bacterium]|jgi:hypothetical protein|nr:twin transmembrane helix small protein [Caulobacteraceae bacterium]